MLYIANTYFLDGPRLLDDLLIFYGELGETITLSIHVSTFPELTDLSQAFHWRKSGMEKTYDVNNLRLDPEEYESVLKLDNVTTEDYGEYVVAVDNGNKVMKFTVTLKQPGINFNINFYFTCVYFPCGRIIMFSIAFLNMYINRPTREANEHIIVGG